MKKRLIQILALCALSLLSGCGTLSHDGGTVATLDRAKTIILMPTFKNATDDEFAAIALTEITASMLMAKDVGLYQTEELDKRLDQPNAAEEKGSYQSLANEVHASYVLLGTVHEYRYKTDLDGDPAVGLTLRLVDVTNGRTVWQGTGSNVGFINASLTSAGQRVARNLVNRMPIDQLGVLNAYRKNHSH